MISVEDARQLRYLDQMSTLTAPCFHNCCQDKADCPNEPNSLHFSDPLIAIYNVKTPELLRQIDDFVGSASVNFESSFIRSDESFNEISSSCDMSCLRMFITDALICSHLHQNRLTPNTA